MAEVREAFSLLLRLRIQTRSICMIIDRPRQPYYCFVLEVT